MTIDLEHLEALCDAATKGPWYDHNPDDEHHMNAYVVSTSPIEPCIDTDERVNDHAIIVAITLLQTPRVACTSDGRYEQNAAFIAAARTAMPALITELRAARNYIALLEQAAGQVIQEQRSAAYAVYSRPECPFQYCDSPPECEGRCHHRPQEPSQ